MGVDGHQVIQSSTPSIPDKMLYRYPPEGIFPPLSTQKNRGAGLGTWSDR